MDYTLAEAYESMSDWSKDANNVRTRLTLAEQEELGVEGLLKMASAYADEVQRQLEEEEERMQDLGDRVKEWLLS